MGIKLANNASTTLASGVSSTSTSLTVTTGTGALFPTIGSGDYFYATLSSSNTVYEIVKVTNRTGDSMGVQRGQAGTSAVSFPAGSRFELRVTKEAVEDYVGETILEEFNDHTTAGALQGDEVIRVVDDPSGTPVVRTTTPFSILAYALAQLNVWTVTQRFNGTYDNGTAIEAAEFRTLTDNDQWVKLRAGSTSDQRSYFAWFEYTGVTRQWLMGRNASNSFVCYDGVGQAHRIEHISGGVTYLSSAGTGAVVINGHPDNGSGTGGVSVRSGGSSPTEWASIGSSQARFTVPVRMEDQSIQTISTDAASYFTINNGSTAAQINGFLFADRNTTKWGVWKHSSNSFAIRNFNTSTYAITINTTDDRVAIGNAKAFAPVCALDVAGPIRPQSYTVATLPSVTGEGQLIYVSDEAGGATLAFSDGTSWRRLSDRAVVT